MYTYSTLSLSALQVKHPFFFPPVRDAQPRKTWKELDEQGGEGYILRYQV